MTPTQIKHFENWRKELIKKNPIVEELDVNFLARFIQGYKFVEKDYNERFMTFFNWYLKTDLKNRKLEDFAEIHRKNICKYITTTKEGYALMVLKISRLIFSEINVEDMVIYVGKFLFDALKRYYK
jgi:hypothetical protein